MTRARQGDELWHRLVTLLQHDRRALAASLTESQELFDAAPDVRLSPLFAQSVVAQVMHRQCEQHHRGVCRWLGHLVFSSSTHSGLSSRWEELAGVVGLCSPSAPLEGTLVVRTDDVDASQLNWPRPDRRDHGGEATIDTVVYDVSPRFHEWSRWELGRVCHGTVRSEVYLDGRGLESCQIGSQQQFQQQLWCDGADREWNSRGNAHDN